ncbi:MAG: hypothetical protein K8I03_00120 [Ignavibacteria bacterium]|nr:hypothetical protein [Ignavibacteria bacterium]
MRQNTRLESTGAEYLVLGYLLREGVQSFKSPENNPGYDLIATNPERNLSCRIQVKSRWGSDYDGGFPIKNFNSEFVVFVALNCGYSFSKKGKEGGKKEPDIYVFPTSICKKYARTDAWGKLFFRKIPQYDKYKNNWELIIKHLKFDDRTKNKKS